MYSLYKKGFTMLEILISLAVLGLLLAMILPKLAEIRANQVLKSGVEDIITALNKARSQTLASLNSSEYGVHFDSNSVTIFTGDTYSAGASSNRVIDVVSPASISNIGLTGGASSVYFARITGMPSANGTVTVSTQTLTKTITISATGAVSSN